MATDTDTPTVSYPTKGEALAEIVKAIGRLEPLVSRLAEAVPGPWMADLTDGSEVSVRAGTAITSPGAYAPRHLVAEQEIESLWASPLEPGPDVEAARDVFEYIALMNPGVGAALLVVLVTGQRAIEHGVSPWWLSTSAKTAYQAAASINEQPQPLT